MKQMSWKFISSTAFSLLLMHQTAVWLLHPLKLFQQRLPVISQFPNFLHLKWSLINSLLLGAFLFPTGFSFSFYLKIIALWVPILCLLLSHSSQDPDPAMWAWAWAGGRGWWSHKEDWPYQRPLLKTSLSFNTDGKPNTPDDWWCLTVCFWDDGHESQDCKVFVWWW